MLVDRETMKFQQGVIVAVSSTEGVVHLSDGREVTFPLAHFVSGWPVRPCKIGDKVTVRLSDTMRLLNVRHEEESSKDNQEWGWYIEGRSMNGGYLSREAAICEAVEGYGEDPKDILVGLVHEIDVSEMLDVEWVEDKIKDILFDSIEPPPDVWLNAGAEEAFKGFLREYVGLELGMSCQGEPLTDQEIQEWTLRMPSSDEWKKYEWPEWIPEQERKVIVSFWRSHGGPSTWITSNHQNHANFGIPLTGTPVIAMCTVYDSDRIETKILSGTYLYRWNTIGMLVSNGDVFSIDTLFKTGRELDTKISKIELEISSSEAQLIKKRQLLENLKLKRDEVVSLVNASKQASS